MPFDPDAYLQKKKAQPAFDPDAYLQAKRDQPGLIESGIRGAAQGAFLGFPDELSAGLGALYDVGEAAVGARGDISLADAYRTRRDVIRQRDKAAEQANPKTFAGAEVGGAIASSVVPGVSALNVAKGAKVGTAVGKGLAGGALVGAGKSDTDIIRGQAPEFLADVASGAAIGGVFGGIANIAGKTLPTLAKKSRDAAGRLSFKAAVGNQQKYTDQAVAKKNLIETGKALLDKGVVRFGDDAEAIANRVQKAQQESGEAIGYILDDIDEIVGKPIVNTNRVASSIRSMSKKLGEVERNKGVAKYLNSEADNIAKDGFITLKKAQRLKNLFPYQFSATSNLSEKQLATNRINKLFSVAMDDAVEEASEIAGGALKNAKFEYGAFSLAEEAARKLSGRNQKNAYLGLRDVIVGSTILGGGVASDNSAGGGAGALAMGVASSLLRRRGNASLAVMMNKLSQKLASAPQTLGPFAPMLRSAAQSGGVPMAATHLLLSQDPEYARAINSDPQLRALNIEVFDDIDKLKADDARVFSLPEKAKPTDRQPTFGIPEE